MKTFLGFTTGLLSGLLLGIGLVAWARPVETDGAEESKE